MLVTSFHFTLCYNNSLGLHETFVFVFRLTIDPVQERGVVKIDEQAKTVRDDNSRKSLTFCLRESNIPSSPHQNTLLTESITRYRHRMKNEIP